jgi:hypothetical protein
MTDHCEKCISNSPVYTAQKCCQLRLKSTFAAQLLRRTACDVLRAPVLAERKNLIHQYEQKYGAESADALRAMVSEMWQKKGV